MLALLLSVLLILPVSAGEAARVFDQAGLFTSEEASLLEQKITVLKESSGLDFAIVTTDDAEGKTAGSYADDFYDNHGFGVGENKSGAVFLIDMDNREAYISTNGYAVAVYEDYIEDMLDDIFEYLPDADYYHAAAAFLDSADRYARSGIRGENGFLERYDPVTDSMETFHYFHPVEILISIFVPLAAAGGVFLGICLFYGRKEKSVPYPFRQQSRLTLTQANDRFIRRSVVTRKIDTSSHGSGGSHGSRGGGRSGGHGGGGRRF